LPAVFFLFFRDGLLAAMIVGNIMMTTKWMTITGIFHLLHLTATRKEKLYLEIFFGDIIKLR
jgi:hypothetical protein